MAFVVGVAGVAVALASIYGIVHGMKSFVCGSLESFSHRFFLGHKLPVPGIFGSPLLLAKFSARVALAHNFCHSL